MGDQYGHRYPNGTPLQGAAMQFSSQPKFGGIKGPPLSNGQTYKPQGSPQQFSNQSFPTTTTYPAQPKMPPAPTYPQPNASPGYHAPPAYSAPNTPSTYSVPGRSPFSQSISSRPPTSLPPTAGIPPVSLPPAPRPVTNANTQPHPAVGRPPPVGQYPPGSPYMPPPPGPGIPPPSGNVVGNKVPNPAMRPDYQEHFAPQGQYPSQAGLVQGMEQLSVTKHGFNKLWGVDNVDLLQCRNILPPQKISAPPIRLPHEFRAGVNCSPEIFSCTMNKLPETNSLLQKSRLPLGILIHPFRDLTELPLIQCSSIVRCRACRTYINPFVYFPDTKRWRCNLCFRVNELPDEFQYDPITRTYGDPTRRPEINSCTIEFIAPSEYMLRPPQPAMYLFLLDVSRAGCDSGYLQAFCGTLLEELGSLPGDSRTQLGFILFDSYLHFFSIPDGSAQARELIVTDIDDVFLPTPDSLLVNLQENRNAIRDLLEELPRRFIESFDVGCALGPALQAAHKLMAATGGRITLFQCSLPNRGPGSLNPREGTGDSHKEAANLGPQTDFYKRLSLECSSQQVAVDIFLLNSQYADLATVGGISQFSGGCIHHFPQFRSEKVDACERLSRALRRYLTRKIGFEAVMRVRCSRGLAIHTFHGNCFVRSTDLLSLPNVNPDVGFGMQVAIEDSLSEMGSICFQAALLYTSSKGERRIRVHTLCLPVTSTLSEVLHSANQQAIIGLLAKMAVDRSLKSSISDAREAFINASIDILSAYKLIDNTQSSGLMAPTNLALIPLYILALLKSVAFRAGSNVRLDDRLFAMLQMKNLPLRELIQTVHPDLYNVTALEEEVVDGETRLNIADKIGLSLQYVDASCAYLLDTPDVIFLILGERIHPDFLNKVLGVPDLKSVEEDLEDLPVIDTPESERLRAFVGSLQIEKPYPVVINVLKMPRQWAHFFINDKADNSLSYHELLNHIRSQVK